MCQCQCQCQPCCKAQVSEEKYKRLTAAIKNIHEQGVAGQTYECSYQKMIGALKALRAEHDV